MEDGAGRPPDGVGGRRLDPRLLVAVAVLSACAVLVLGIVVARKGDDRTAGPGGATVAGSAGPGPTAGSSTGGGRPAPGALAQVRSWSFAAGVKLTDPAADVARFKGFGLVVVDGVNTPVETVQALRRQGSVVLAYLDIGAIEKDRPWTEAAQPYVLGRWQEWDEDYADVSQAGYRDLVVNTNLPPILAKDFDGVFLDAVDMIDEHPAQRAGMVELVGTIAGVVHRRGGFVFSQNGGDSVDAYVEHLDGWNREDVSFTYDFRTRSYAPVSRSDHEDAISTIRRLRARGLLVTSVDYTPTADGPEARQALRAACDAGAVPSVADIGLTRTDPPAGC